MNFPDTNSASTVADHLDESEAGAAAITRDIVTIGASAGGVETLRRLVGALPQTYGGAIFVVVHVGAESRSELPAILSRAGPLPAVLAQDGATIRRGHIHVAPPDFHLLVQPGRLAVVRGPGENRHRPAIDPLFRSAAWAYGPRVVGIVLSGSLDDGTAGLWAIKSCGGTTVVQEPNEALYPEMPSNALMHNRVDHRLLVNEIAPLLVRLAGEPARVPVQQERPASIRDEVEFTRLNRDMNTMGNLGMLSPFTCPTCRGALWEINEAGHLRYRCHTGHAFSQASLLLEQGSAAEESLYAALRTIEEKAAALRRLAQHWSGRSANLREDYEKRAVDLESIAEVLRGLLAGETM
ncbi:MAG TPA: chemotaxis protein CheB [Burkholderiaceae bacterium]|nr:chemotaxis protein CheB [Burkholderiaceae bacterium]